jgi:hypothetical protein
LRGEPITPFLFNYFTNINQSSLLKNGKKSKVSAGHFGVSSGSVQNDTLRIFPYSRHSAKAQLMAARSSN